MSGRNPRLEVKREAKRLAVEGREVLSFITGTTHHTAGPISLEDWQRFEGHARRVRSLADALIALAEIMGRIETAGSGAFTIGDRRFDIPAIPATDTKEGTP